MSICSSKVRCLNQKLVLDNDNQIALMPDEKRVAEAVIKVNVSKVKEAQRAL